MSIYGTNDPYIDPRSGVLRNKIGLTTQAALDRVEAAYASVRAIELAYMFLAGKVELSFDLKHMKAIHKHLFADVYDWAGQVRTVDISRDDTRFAHYATIEKEVRRLGQSLSRENYLKGLDKAEFSRRAGYYMGELNVLHPFRDGNGRMLREYISELALQSGYKIQWDQVKREQMSLAAIEAYHGNSSLLADLISARLYDYDQQKAFEILRGSKKEINLE